MPYSEGGKGRRGRGGGGRGRGRGGGGRLEGIPMVVERRGRLGGVGPEVCDGGGEGEVTGR